MIKNHLINVSTHYVINGHNERHRRVTISLAHADIFRDTEIEKMDLPFEVVGDLIRFLQLTQECNHLTLQKTYQDDGYQPKNAS